MMQSYDVLALVEEHLERLFTSARFPLSSPSVIITLISSTPLSLLSCPSNAHAKRESALFPSKNRHFSTFFPVARSPFDEKSSSTMTTLEETKKGRKVHIGKKSASGLVAQGQL